MVIMSIDLIRKSTLSNIADDLDFLKREEIVDYYIVKDNIDTIEMNVRIVSHEYLKLIIKNSRELKSTMRIKLEKMKAEA